jgi:hypothetical protein
VFIRVYLWFQSAGLIFELATTRHSETLETADKPR